MNKKNFNAIKTIYDLYTEAGRDFNSSKDSYYWGKRYAYSYILQYYFDFDVENVDDIEELCTILNKKGGKINDN